MADLIDYLEAAVIAEIAANQSQVNTSYLSEADSIVQLYALASVNTSAHPFGEVHQRLVGNGVIRTVTDDVTGDFFQLNTGRAVKIVNDNHQKETSLIHKYRLVGRRYIEAAVEKLWNPPVPLDSDIVFDDEIVRIDVVDAPASDRIVRFDDNQERDRVIGDLEEFEKAVRESNDLGDIVGDDRDRIASEVRAGRELLKAPSVRVRAVVAVLLPVLTFIANEFAGGLIGELAVQLLGSLTTMLGL